MGKSSTMFARYTVEISFLKSYSGDAYSNDFSSCWPKLLLLFFILVEVGPQIKFILEAKISFNFM